MNKTNQMTMECSLPEMKRMFKEEGYIVFPSLPGSTIPKLLERPDPVCCFVRPECREFYIANKMLLKNATEGISKSLSKISKTCEIQNKALASVFESVTKSISFQSDYLSGLGSAFTNIPKFDLL